MCSGLGKRVRELVFKEYVLADNQKMCKSYIYPHKPLHKQNTCSGLGKRVRELVFKEYVLTDNQKMCKST